MYYRLHNTKVTDEEFISSARTWHWDFDENGALYEKEVAGYYSACATAMELLAYIDNGHVGDEEPIAIFDGVEAEYTPDSDCAGEVWVKPIALIGWTTVGNLRREVD